MHSREVRYKAVIHYLHFLRSLRKVAQHYNVSKSSLHRWIKSDPKHTTKRSKKVVNANIRECLKQYIQANPFATWSMIADTLWKHCDVKMSRSTAGRLLKQHGYSRKKAYRVVDKRHDSQQVLTFCEEYLQCVDDGTDTTSEVVCVDEAGFYMGEQGRVGYAPKGTRLNVKTSRTLRRIKYTLVMAISPTRGIVHYEILDHNCRKDDFVGFITRLDVPKGTRVLMDNIAFHRSASTREAMLCKGLTPLHTPPYSPRLNAIENVFGVVKARFRRACPVNVDDTVDYVGVMEEVLADALDVSVFFKRVETFVRTTLASSAANFKGYDD